MAGFVLAVLAHAADISGTWLGKDVAFKFSQKGSKLSGKMYGDDRSSPIVEGTVAGDLVTFVVQTQEQSGNQINDTRLRFTGKTSGDEMELARERESSTNAGNGGAVQMKNSAKRTVRVKLLTH